MRHRRTFAGPVPHWAMAWARLGWCQGAILPGLLALPSCELVAGIDDRHVAAVTAELDGSVPDILSAQHEDGPNAPEEDRALDALPENDETVERDQAVRDAQNCPVGFGFQTPRVSWSVREGNLPEQSYLDLPVVLPDGPLSDLIVRLSSDAPAWLHAPATPTSRTLLRLSSPNGVPYSAWPAPRSLEVVVQVSDMPACSSKVGIDLDVTNVLHAPLPVEMLPAGIEAAAWQSDLGRFVMLDPAARRLHFLDVAGDTPVMSTTVEFPGTQPVAPTVAANDSRLYLLAGDRLWRLDPSGGMVDSLPLPTAVGHRSLAAAAGWVLIGDEGGATLLVSDSRETPEVSVNLPPRAHTPTSDGHVFSFKTPIVDQWSLYWLDGSSLPALGQLTPCQVVSSAQGMGVEGRRVAILSGDVGHANVKSWQFEPECDGYSSFAVPNSGHAAGVIGLSASRVLVIPRMNSDFMDLSLYDVLGGKEIGEGLVNQPVHAIWVNGVVMGGSRFGLVVSSTPLLVEI